MTKPEMINFCEMMLDLSLEAEDKTSYAYHQQVKRLLKMDGEINSVIKHLEGRKISRAVIEAELKCAKTLCWPVRDLNPKS